MDIKIYRDNENGFEAFNKDVKFWSNGLGELHHHGEYDITESELPDDLKKVYKDLYFECEPGSIRYLVETPKGFGIALLNEYDEHTAGLASTSMEGLFEYLEKDAQTIGADPLFVNANVYVGEGTGFLECHDLIVVFPADISKEEYLAAAEKLDKLAYQSVFAVQAKNKAIELCDGLMKLQEDPQFRIASDMAYIYNNIELDEPLTQEEIYTLASKLQDVSGSWFTSSLLHEEHLDAIRYMLEYGIHEDHTPELPELKHDDVRKLLLTANREVFGTLVELVGINNEVHYSIDNENTYDADELSAAISAINSIKEGKGRTPETVAPEASQAPEKKPSLADKIKNATERAAAQASASIEPMEITQEH